MDVTTRSVVVNKEREWSTDQDGPNDKPVEIWFNSRWVPAYFKDIKAGDFFMMLGLDLEPGKCFVARSDAIKMGVWSGHRTYMVKDGMEIAQAPAIKDINPVETLPHRAVPITYEE